MFRLISVMALFFGFCAAPAFAADGMSEPNAVSLEGMGRGLLWSIDYDRLITDEIGVGIGYSSWTINGTDSNGNEVFGLSVTVVPVYLNYYFYNPSSSRWFLTAGLDFISSKFRDSDFNFSDGGFAFVPGVGYEFRSESGFLLRVTAYGLLASHVGALWGGLSLGYAF